MVHAQFKSAMVQARVHALFEARASPGKIKTNIKGNASHSKVAIVVWKCKHLESDQEEEDAIGQDNEIRPNLPMMTAGLKMHAAGILLVINTVIQSRNSTTKGLGRADLKEVLVNKTKSCTHND